MNRLRAALANDIRIQYRNGFYIVSLALMPVWFAVLLAIRDATGDGSVLPFPKVLLVVAVTNMLITTFYFMAALVLREKDEGVLTALVVTPLRPETYLMAKALSLAVLATLETGLVIVLVHDGVYESVFNAVALVLGMVLLGLVLCLAGFIAVVPHRAINTFIPPSILWTTLLMIPLAAPFGLFPDGPVTTVLLWLHPVTPAVVLLEGAIDPETRIPWLSGVVLALWVVAALAWSRSVFNRFVRRSGLRRKP